MSKIKSLCIIPARSGSKGIKNKNLINLNGKPLIAWTIEAAIKSKEFDKIYVSTESDQIAQISIRYGAEIPFKRPKSLASDNTHSVHVVINVLEWFYDNNGYLPEYTSMLLPTSPLRQPFHISESLDIMRSKGFSSLVSIIDLGIHITNIRHFENEIFRRTFNNEHPNTQRQDSKNLFSVNGSIFIAKTEELVKNKTFHTQNCYGYLMDKYTSIDINNDKDLEFAKKVMKNFEPWKNQI